MHHVSYYKKGYPRPQQFRADYEILNGKWNFAFDENNDKDYSGGVSGQLEINVPFVYQTEASGINVQKRVDCVWYSREVVLDAKQAACDVLLHFEGSDYKTEVWVNGKRAGEDKGAYHRLTFDVTPFVQEGKNVVAVKVTDDYDVEKPRGKQRWKDENFGCWYVDTTGIYKTVWMEFVSHSRLENLSVQGNVDTNSITVTYDAVNCGYADGGYEVRTCVTYEGKPVAEITCPLTAETGGTALWLGDEVHLWETGCGRLYELSVTLIKNGKEIDNIRSYCGVRKIEAKEGKILLNGKPLYQKLVLDQGYWKGSDLTPPSEEALVKDITDMMDMGFNGARKHQKVEDERFLYYADLYGYLVWAEMPSMYKNTEKSRAVFAEEWTLAVLQQKNHPCVITWVPFNESWGIEDVLFDVTVQNFVNDVYHLTKLLDDTRLVITNDGWEHTLSDVLTIHNYEQDGKTLHSWYDTLEKCCAHNWPEGRKGAFANGYGYKGQPVMITEFGGTAFVKDTVGINWGYGQGVKDDEEFLRRFEGLVTAIDDVPFMCGYCYTQVTDVQHEVNGLEDENHVPKFPKEKIKAILQKRGR